MNDTQPAPRFLSLDALVDTPEPSSREAAAPAWQGAVRLGVTPRTENRDAERKEVLPPPVAPEPIRREREGAALAIINNKGGVGKTTTVVNIAAALALKAPVLLLDLDGQGSATRSLGRRTTGVPTLYDVLTGRMAVEDAIQSSSVAGLDYIAGGPALVSLQDYLVRYDVSPTLLEDVLQPLFSYYGYILMDCAPTFTPLSIQALVAAHGSIVPVTPHFLAVEGMQNLFHTIEHVDPEAASLAPIWGIALTMVDDRYRSTQRNIAELRSRYGGLVFQAEVPFNIELAEAPASGKPIFEYAARSGATRSYWNLSKELAQRVRHMQPAAQQA